MPNFDPAAVAGLAGPNAYPNSTGAGPDFPGSSGDREKGKFRPSAFPRLDTVAVTNDDGSPVAAAAAAIESAVLDELRGIRLGIQKLLEIQCGIQVDLVDEGRALGLGVGL